MKKAMTKNQSAELTKQIVADYTENHISMEELSKKYNCDAYWRLKRAGIAIKPQSVFARKYPINQDIFEIIDTEEKAYWLGFLMADGYNSGRDIKLILHSKDEEILEKFNIFLGTNKPIRYETNKSNTKYAKIVIENKKITQDLTKHGMTKAKTFSLVYPNIDKELDRHFIRGIFDGDGCVQEKCIWSITGTRDLLQEIDKKMLNLNFSKSFYYNQRWPERNNGIYSFYMTSKSNLLLIYDYLYKSSTIFLKRKKDKFDTVLLNTRTNKTFFGKKPKELYEELNPLISYSLFYHRLEKGFSLEKSCLPLMKKRKCK